MLLLGDCRWSATIRAKSFAAHMARRSKHRMKEYELVSGKELPKATSLREVRAQVDRPKEGLM